jgi:hypothetical protein
VRVEIPGFNLDWFSGLTSSLFFPEIENLNNKNFRGVYFDVKTIGIYCGPLATLCFFLNSYSALFA